MAFLKLEEDVESGAGHSVLVDRNSPEGMFVKGYPLHMQVLRGNSVVVLHLTQAEIVALRASLDAYLKIGY